jgi:hypothetical protein
MSIWDESKKRKYSDRLRYIILRILNFACPFEMNLKKRKYNDRLRYIILRTLNFACPFEMNLKQENIVID